MHWLTKYMYTNKEYHAHSDIYALHIMTTLFNTHLYVHVSSSGTSVGTKFTATYVGMVVE